jgi:predicted hotdog family 3-hydroxylacyl-ACP dehydratase
MCLLDEVTHYDERAIACRATSHQSAGNPLRHEGRLPALAGIEYAAQALAAHCALVGAGTDLRADHGVLAGVRAVALRVDRLDDVDEALEVRAERLIVDGTRLLYGFAIEAGGRALLNGRVAVVLRAKETK